MVHGFYAQWRFYAQWPVTQIHVPVGVCCHWPGIQVVCPYGGVTYRPATHVQGFRLVPV
jgi:hypothetical protein